MSGKNIPEALTRTGVQSWRSGSCWGRLHTTKTFQPKQTANQFIFYLNLLTQLNQRLIMLQLLIHRKLNSWAFWRDSKLEGYFLRI